MSNAPEGFEDVKTSREDRRLVRLSLKLYAADLRKLQKKDTEHAVTNPVIAATVEKIAGVSDNQPGLIKRFMLDGDSDPEEPKKEKVKKDPRQQDLPLTDRKGRKGPPRVGPRGSMRIDNPRA
jgi:hypothetical protein